MLSLLRRYARWLHTMWPAGTVERLPETRADGTTAVPGVRIVGDLTGIPLLKFSSDSGARAVDAILAEPDFVRPRATDPDLPDIAIIGAGVSGVAAALRARKAGVTFQWFEASRLLSTVANFPRAKPIYTYPAGMRPDGELQFRPEVHPKEQLLEGMEKQVAEAVLPLTLSRVERIERRGGLLHLHHEAKNGSAAVTRARRVIVAIGRAGSHRRLGVPGEELDGKVFNRLHDPADFAGRDVLVVGGGDSAVEASIALAGAGARVTHSYRGRELARPKPGNLEKFRALERDPLADVGVEHPVSESDTTAAGAFARAGKKPHAPGFLRRAMESEVVRIEPARVILRDAEGKELALANDAVFPMIGREAPLEFFRRSGIPIRGEWRPRTYASFAAFFLFCAFLYNWKGNGLVNQYFQRHGLFPYDVPAMLEAAGRSAAARSKDPATLLGTAAISLRDPGFFYSLAYCLCVLLFGIARIRRRRSPYVTRQTATLIAVQWIPLFLLPYLVLPYLGHNGVFDAGLGKTVGDHLFPAAGPGGGDREYWRAFGFILAWPLFLWNVFSSRPMTWWLVIAFVQTFVIIPLIVRRWGKGAYCGWICSCGALAETMGDAHRQKMPHGPIWNRVNMTGQAVLAAALLLLLGRAISWIAPATAAGRAAERFYGGLLSGWSLFGVELNYYHLVDVFLAGIVGVGTYFWFSGRVWCRFACPLAALMNVYARFTRFRIFAEKSRCISCNVCTSVCHQGIDVMNFANKGLPMADPQCVRCSACVVACPTGVLTFGRYDGKGLPVHDRLPASPVLLREGR